MNHPIGKPIECNCNQEDCAICYDYSTHGICKVCGNRFGVADLDDGECWKCGNKDIKDGEFN